MQESLGLTRHRKNQTQSQHLTLHFKQTTHPINLKPTNINHSPLTQNLKIKKYQTILLKPKKIVTHQKTLLFPPK